MKSKSETQIKEERELRNISDYVHSCLRRAESHIKLIAHIKRDKKLFSRKLAPITLSLCDVYSKDIVTTLNHILDEDTTTSSLFSLVKHIKGPRIRKGYSDRLKLIKKNMNALVRIRNNQVSHFNTKLNVHENGYSHVHQMYMMMRPRDTKKNIKELEGFFWDIKERLKINGLFMVMHGDLTEHFQRLTNTK